MQEVESCYKRQIAADKAAAEEAEFRRIREHEELSSPDRSMAEYIAKRTGKEYLPGRPGKFVNGGIQ